MYCPKDKLNSNVGVERTNTTKNKFTMLNRELKHRCPRGTNGNQRSNISLLMRFEVNASVMISHQAPKQVRVFQPWKSSRDKPTKGTVNFRVSALVPLYQARERTNNFLKDVERIAKITYLGQLLS